LGNNWKGKGVAPTKFLNLKLREFFKLTQAHGHPKEGPTLGVKKWEGAWPFLNKAPPWNRPKETQKEREIK